MTIVSMNKRYYYNNSQMQTVLILSTFLSALSLEPFG